MDRVFEKIFSALAKVADWAGMAKLAEALGNPYIALAAISVPFIAFVAIVGMICRTIVSCARLRAQSDIELTKITGVNPRKRWWQFWK